MEIVWKEFDPTSVMLVAGFFLLDIFIGNAALRPPSAATAHLYSLNVAKGDAELIVFPGNMKILVDAGLDASIIPALQKIISASDPYIDLAIISGPNPAESGGFMDVLDHYSVGAFLYDGRTPLPEPSAWADLEKKIKAKNIPMLALGAGDAIHIRNTENDAVTIISPDLTLAKSPDPTDAALIERVQTAHWSALFMANAGSDIENYLVAGAGKKLMADILKAANRGAKYSPTAAFLKAVGPKITLVNTGKGQIIDVRYDTIRKKLIYGP